MNTIPIKQINPIGPVDNTPMELIIKPTQACNFKCTFCSSTDIAVSDSVILDHQYIFDFLDRYPKTHTIIVNGGDPLMMSPSYYWKIIDYIEKHCLPTTLSFTTNLWPFYIKPELWTELFRHERMGICTSFNYGDTRRITKDRVYTEEDFWKVSDMMLEKVGYRPDFIAVITDDNDDTAIENVELAKRMDVECKLNYAMASGDQIKPYQLSKIYETYCKVYDMGLMPWEYNTKQMARRLKTGSTTCPQSRECDTYIRAMNPGGDYYSCGSLADDYDYPIDFKAEIYGDEKFTPLQHDLDIWCLKDECLTCPMFDICNGCKKTIKDMKKHGIVEQHCKTMKTIAPKILEVNFGSEPEELDRRLACV